MRIPVTESPKMILLVEDDLGARKSMTLVLESLGFIVTSVETLGGAVALLGSITPDCIVLDVNQPNGRGAAVVLASERAAPHVPIVVLTGDVAMEQESILSGAQEFILKGNASAGLLKQKINRAMVRHQVRGAFQPVRQVLTESNEKLQAAIEILEGKKH